MLKKFYCINQYIQAKELRVVDEKGKQVGILPLEKALEQAREQGVDLVEVAAAANPPVARLIDFKKFIYLEKKKAQGEKRGVKTSELKEIRLTPFIGKADLDFRVKKGEGYLKEGNRLKATVFFTGRQIAHKEFGVEVLKRYLEALAAWGKPEGEPKWLGKTFFTIIVPEKKDKNAKVQN
ncbi:translation initiation factor IF-3 [Candidatus Shapirobacteria bacterium]|nr:translation initiation factor IF-3 [Candidatus Shapirobacteria bacterium]